VIHEPDGPADWGTSVPFSYRDQEARQHWQECFDRLSAEVFLGNLKVSSSPLNCLPDSHVARMLHFLLSAFGLVEGERAVELVDPSSDGDCFPLSLPEPQGGGFRRFSQEGWAVYQRVRDRGAAPSPLAVEVLELCDGTRSLRAIASLLDRDAVAEAVRQLISSNHLICFARRLAP
jgi:hypothetical protein